MIDQLPNSYREIDIYVDLENVKNDTLLTNLTAYSINIMNDSANPFDTLISSQLNYVEIEINFTTTSYNDVYDYINQIEGLNRIYYIDQMLTTFNIDDIDIQITLYTFYVQ